MLVEYTECIYLKLFRVQTTQDRVCSFKEEGQFNGHFEKKFDLFNFVIIVFTKKKISQASTFLDNHYANTPV